MKPYRSLLHQTKQAAGVVARLSTAQKNTILTQLIDELRNHTSDILTANKLDVAASKARGKTAAFIDRLTLTDKTITGMISQLQVIIESHDAIDATIEARVLANGIRLQKVRVPIGVIAVIYEARPNVTIDSAALCIKSGNAAVLKGGSDALHTNKVLIQGIHAALQKNNITTNIVRFIDATDHAVIIWLVKQQDLIDLVIPRGGYELVNMVARHTRIPILYHGAGGARIFIDRSANIQKAVDICVNARTSRPGTCNSADTILVHQDIATPLLPRLAAALRAKSVEIRGDKKTCAIIDAVPASASDYRTEFLDLIITIKIVKNVDEAVRFIAKYTKHHSEGIVAEDQQTIQQFVQSVDAAAVFVNCSTRFHDGGEFGLGAEMGIATGTLHARGPVGLQELTTYKWIVQGNGHIRI